MHSLLVVPFFLLLLVKEQLFTGNFQCTRSYRKSINCKMDYTCLSSFQVSFYVGRVRINIFRSRLLFFDL
jgi:hypothetical protein